MRRFISGQLLKEPNMFILSTNAVYNYLCSGQQPKIQYLHSSRHLISTIMVLQKYQSIANQKYSLEIENELKYLDNARISYGVFMRKYVEFGGNITAEGISNLYCYAANFQMSASWLQQFVYPKIDGKLSFMSVLNLKNLINGLQRYNKDDQMIHKIQLQLQTRFDKQQNYQEVQNILNEIDKFEQVDASPSANLLVCSLQLNRNYYIYQIYKSLMMLMKSDYVLHTDSQ